MYRDKGKLTDKNNTLLAIIVMLAGMALTAAFFGTPSNAEASRKTAADGNAVSLSGQTDKYYNEQTKQKLFELSLGDQRFKEVYDNYSQYPQYLLDVLCENPSLIELVLIYGTGYDPSDCYITRDEIQQDIPLFIQWDKRWGFAEYGDDIIALSGCGPTCLSMVSVGLTGNTVYTPLFIADYSQENGYYQSGVGTSWDLFTEGSGSFGISCEELPKDKDTVYSRLAQGYPIICSMIPGDFTDSGHFIVLAGIKDNKIKVNDPNSYENSEKLWEYSELEWQIRNLWGFCKK